MNAVLHETQEAEYVREALRYNFALEGTRGPDGRIHNRAVVGDSRVVRRDELAVAQLHAARKGDYNDYRN